MAKTLPLPANQVGSPCDRRSPASGNARQSLRRRSTSAASLLAICRTGCDRGFLGGGGPAVAFLAEGVCFLDVLVAKRSSAASIAPRSRPCRGHMLECSSGGRSEPCPLPNWQ